MSDGNFKPRPKVKQRIEEAAMKLCASKAPTDITIADIAKAAHCSQQTLYRYYGGKEELWLACTARWFNRLGDRMIDHLNGIESYKDKMRKVFWLILDFFEHRENDVEIFLSIVHMQNWMLDESFQQTEVTKVMLAMIIEGQKKNILTREVDEVTILDYIYGILQRLIEMRRLRCIKQSNAERATILFEMLWRAIANPDTVNNVKGVRIQDGGQTVP